MRVNSFELPCRAARSTLSAFALILSAGFVPVALAQEEPAAQETIPAETAPVESAPVEATPAETVDTVPVADTAAPAEEAAAPAPEGTTELDTIEVTGSRIRRTDYETAQPIAVVSREDIERTGLTNLGDILQRIPAAGSALNRNFNNGGNGQTEIDLRNLGSGRVLVLVNGHRWVAGTSLADSSVDLNTIPVSIIERIEVLKDGASAVYGSDAIAGVINIITRKDFSGVQFGGQLQSFDDGKGQTTATSLSFGNISGKSSIFVDFNFVRQDALKAGDREQSAVPKFNTNLPLSGRNFTNEFVYTRGSAVGPEGYFIFVPNSTTESALNSGSTGPGSAGEKCPVLAGAESLGGEDIPVVGDPLESAAGLRLCQISPIRGEAISAITAGGSDTLQSAADKMRFNGSIFGAPDPYQHNYAPANYLLTPFEQDSIFTQINHSFLDWLNLNSQILYTVSRSRQELAEEPLRVGDIFGAPPFSQAYLAVDQIYNPLGMDIGRSAGGVGLVGLGAIVRRIIEAGPRIADRENTTIFLKNQFDGSFDFAQRLFSYDAGYSYGRNTRVVNTAGSFDMERVAAALGPTTSADGLTGCPSAANPLCVPLNLFGPVGSVTKEMLDYVTYKAAETNQSVVQDVFTNFSTEFDELSGLLPYGLLNAPIGVAVGAEYRQDEFGEVPDPFTTLGISSALNGGATNGRQNVREAYLELAVPILADVFLADELDLSLAGRYTKYNLFDPKLTGKAGLRWKPINDLLVRGTYSQSFRAPNLQELFLGKTDSFPSVEDPCAQTNVAGEPEPRSPGTDVDSNCDAEGVPEQPSTSSQVFTVFEGSTDLQPEIANTFTTGFVYSPEFIQDFNVYVDYWNIQLKGFISFVGPEDVLDYCYKRPAGSPRPDQFCDKVERDPATGKISRVSASPVNFAKLETSGVDFAFDYVLPVGNWIAGANTWGNFKLAFDSQYLIAYDQFIPAPDGSERIDGITAYHQGFAGYNAGDQPLPKLKANTTLEWKLNSWTASVTTRFIQGTTEHCSDPNSPTLASLGLCDNPDTNLLDGTDDSTNDAEDIFYHNVQFGYNVPAWNTDIVLGVVNVLDQDPPVSYSSFANSAPATLYETWGSRQPYLKLDISF